MRIPRVPDVSCQQTVIFEDVWVQGHAQSILHIFGQGLLLVIRARTGLSLCWQGRFWDDFELEVAWSGDGLIILVCHSDYFEGSAKLLGLQIFLTLSDCCQPLVLLFWCLEFQTYLSHPGKYKHFLFLLCIYFCQFERNLSFFSNPPLFIFLIVR